MVLILPVSGNCLSFTFRMDQVMRRVQFNCRNCIMSSLFSLIKVLLSRKPNDLFSRDKAPNALKELILAHISCTAVTLLSKYVPYHKL